MPSKVLRQRRDGVEGSAKFVGQARARKQRRDFRRSPEAGAQRAEVARPAAVERQPRQRQREFRRPLTALTAFPPASRLLWGRRRQQ